MKTYPLKKRTHQRSGAGRKLLLLVLLLFMSAVFLQNCSILRQDKGVSVVVHLDRENIGEASVLIFNFKEPAHALNAGAVTAEMFHLELLKTKVFKVTALHSQSSWARIADTEEERLLAALQEAQAQSFDYILLGDLRSYIHGGLDKTAVEMKVRLIEVKSRTTIFLATGQSRHQGKDNTAAMATQLQNLSHPPQLLIQKLVRKFIRELTLYRLKKT